MPNEYDYIGFTHMHDLIAEANRRAGLCVGWILVSVVPNQSGEAGYLAVFRRPC